MIFIHAESIWKECETLGEYTVIYLKSDVLLLADILEISVRVLID